MTCLPKMLLTVFVAALLLLVCGDYQRTRVINTGYNRVHVSWGECISDGDVCYISTATVLQKCGFILARNYLTATLCTPRGLMPFLVCIGVGAANMADLQCSTPIIRSGVCTWTYIVTSECQQSVSGGPSLVGMMCWVVMHAGNPATGLLHPCQHRVMCCWPHCTQFLDAVQRLHMQPGAGIAAAAGRQLWWTTLLYF